jgi:tRNA G18 (ribose-2'-O)-methylase SpoU
MTEDRIHERHKIPTLLTRPRELVLVSPPLRSNVNLSRIVRAASCCGVTRLIACGNPKIDPKIARDGLEQVSIETRRSLQPVLKNLRQEGYCLVGLEQTNDSVNIHEFSFDRRTALVIGHERLGIDDDSLRLLDVAIEIPVFGLPFSYNVATATSMALYEYCRQFPMG